MPVGFLGSLRKRAGHIPGPKVPKDAHPRGAAVARRAAANRSKNRAARKARKVQRKRAA